MVDNSAADGATPERQERVEAAMTASPGGRLNSLAVLTSAGDSGSMPGQGKRRRRQEAGRQRLAARTAPDVGQWEVVLETKDQAQLRGHVRRLRAEGIDESLIRIDTLCRRPVEQSTYRLSRFADNIARTSDREVSDH
ncbi:hypothetical protein GCM10010280_59160 [Streptomyces pilosus]|uniref:Uncharacterized protein n=1 Tax=Streptomyces pilosus TaxID=28893 RepID=A0A918F5N5_9ACTN|nr:hypothetical protein GCM10010280_59160 [Streptomyces pilosus]